MKRWNRRKKEWRENKKIDLFIKEIEILCRKHKLSISHEDSHGNFEIESFFSDNINWLRTAYDRT